MRLISDVGEMRHLCRGIVARREELALVPTMGALHAGHLAMVRQAVESRLPVVVSIFVNPTQFGPDEDYHRYPRTPEKDLAALDDIGGVDAVFTPGVGDMYPDGTDALVTEVTVTDLSDHLCGAFRPGHFKGVATVVTKLFNICVPTVAFFGKKDAQQYVILKRMARDLSFGIEIVGVETVRENDGLALSSRNNYLTAQEREQATVLYQAVRAARDEILKGETRSDVLVEQMTGIVDAAPLARLQYADVVSVSTLKPRARFDSGEEVLAALAVYFGSTRLIDSAFVTVP